MTDVPVPDRAALAGLGNWADELEKPDPVFGRWVVEEPVPGEATQMPWVELLPDGERFVADAGRLGFVVPFDWMAWLAGPDGRAYREDRSRVASAPAADLVRLLTSIVRGDRFSEGELLGAFESGLLAAVARRARQLAQEQGA
jgi:hypothetical protein